MEPTCRRPEYLRDLKKRVSWHSPRNCLANESFERFFYTINTLIFFFLRFLVSVFFPLAAFLFPPVCYMKLKNKGFMRRKYIPLWLLTIFGIAVMILGTTMAIVNQAGNCAFTETQRYWCPETSHSHMLFNSSNITATAMPLFTSSPLPVNSSS